MEHELDIEGVIFYVDDSEIPEFTADRELIDHILELCRVEEQIRTGKLK